MHLSLSFSLCLLGRACVNMCMFLQPNIMQMLPLKESLDREVIN